MVTETNAINPKAIQYADTYGRNDTLYTTAIREAVQYGLSLSELEEKPICCPVGHAAYDYAMKFEEFGTEQKFRIQQAVKYGYSIINEPVEINSVYHTDKMFY